MGYKYDLDTYLLPFEESEVMYFETVLPIEGEVNTLLYPIEEIIAVTNYGLDIVYEENKDYIIKDRKLIITPHSRIKQIAVDEYYLKEKPQIAFPIKKERCRYKFEEDRYILFGESDTMSSKQIAVTYRHKLDDVLFVQKEQKEQLNHFFTKLEKEKKATVVFYGDSITVGCNSSGTVYGNNTKPYAPSFPEMIVSYLNKKFDANINYVNTAVGGMNTKWGVENYEERVNKHHPDLLVLAFGMNDGSLAIEEHINLIKSIIYGVREKNPNCDIVLVSTTVPNIETKCYDGNQKSYYEAYETLDIPNIAFVNMTKTHLSLLKRKCFKDMSGNNVNHPNDFLVRVYAQAILRAMGVL